MFLLHILKLSAPHPKMPVKTWHILLCFFFLKTVSSFVIKYPLEENARGQSAWELKYNPQRVSFFFFFFPAVT